MILSVVFSVIAISGFSQDHVVLKNGAVVEGEVIHRDENTGDLQLKTPGGRISKYKNDEIVRVDYGVSRAKSRSGDGYVGLSLGLSAPYGVANGPTTGAHVNLLTCGLMLGGHVGLAFNWFGAAYGSTNAQDEVPYSLGGLSFGLVFRGYLSDKLQLDVRPMLGGGLFLVDYPGELPAEQEMVSASIDILLRYKLSDSFSFLTSAGLHRYNPVRSLNVFNLQAGLSYDF